MGTFRLPDPLAHLSDEEVRLLCRRRARDLSKALQHIEVLEAALMELRQSLIGGVEGVRVGCDMAKWAEANERLLAKRKK